MAVHVVDDDQMRQAGPRFAQRALDPLVELEPGGGALGRASGQLHPA